MRLVDLIKSLVDALDELGDCDVFITTKNETKLYDAVVEEYLPELDVLKIEAITAEDYEKIEGEEQNE